jgi:hypothetical protein
MPNSERTLHALHGSATVQPLGAMVAPVVFRRPGHRDFAPLQVAPWADEPGWQHLDGGLARLRGEWPCVPFGRIDRPAGLPAAWTHRDPGDRWAHGFAMHHEWSWIDAGPHDAAGKLDDCLRRSPRELSLAIDLPADSPVARLERRVRWLDDGAALVLESILHPRHDVECPAALHPTIRLDAGELRLRMPPHGAGRTYPVPAEPGVSRLEPDAAFATLDAVPLAHGRTLDGAFADLTRYPQPADSEELLQLTCLEGPVHADFLDEGWTLALDWDRNLLPDLMLWVSHGGRRHPPWNGRHRALGLEPVAGPFDLGRVAAPPPAHPMASRRGLELRAGVPTTLWLRFEARPLGDAAAQATRRTASGTP